MPTVDGAKEPAINHVNSDDYGDLIETPLESELVDDMLVDPETAAHRIRDGEAEGFAIYFGKPAHGTEDLLAVDRDAPEKFPDDEMPETGLIAVSGSGTDPGHYYYTSGSMERGSADAVLGEVRVRNQYCLVAGSLHPSGGIYHLSKDDEPTEVSWDDIPEALQPATTGETRDMSDVRLTPKDSGDSSKYENDIGMGLGEVREKSEKLDRLLTRLNPGGYPSRSEADMAAAGLLWFWRFSEQQVIDIMLHYRRYDKTERESYLKHTVSKACTGERLDVDDDGNIEGDIMSLLPVKRLDALSHNERRRYASKRGIDWPDVHEVRERLEDNILTSIEEQETAVKSAPTGAGKTHTVATKKWKGMESVTHGGPVVHAHRTREARDQARQMSDENGVDAYSLKGRKELCPVAKGWHDPGNDHGNPGITIDGEAISEWVDHKCDRQGLPFSHAHRWAGSEISGKLPCNEGEGECPALGQFDGIPRDDNGNPTHDVIHCTHQFLHVPGLRMHTNICVDEKPAFGIDLTPEEVRESVNAYLDYLDAPVDNYTELVTASKEGRDPNAPTAGNIEGIPVKTHNASFREEMEKSFSGEDVQETCPECDGTGDRLEDGVVNESVVSVGDEASNDCPECNGHGTIYKNRGQPPLDWYRKNPNAHALAPAFARAIWKAEETAGGRKSARIPFRPPRWGNADHDEAGWNRVYVDVVLNEQWEVVEAESLPDFSLAKSVIGLDAHPQPHDPMWMANVHPDMQTDYTLTTDERTLYRRYERGLFTVQVGEGVQPVASAKWLDKGQGSKFEAVIGQLRDHYGDEFDAAITSMSARNFVMNAMREAGVEEPEMMHYGEEESRNDFAGKEVGLVAGSIDPGDRTVINLCARLNFDVDPCYKECPICDGTGTATDEDGNGEWCNTCDGTGEVRERGRTFEGEDSEQADAVLKGVREHHVAQSAGRWARDAEDPEDNATVYIISEASPTGFIDAYAPGATWTTSDEQRERLEYVRDQEDGVTAKEVAEACGCSKRAANRTLSKAADKGLLELTPGAGPYGAHLYWPGEGFNPNGAVDLEPDADSGQAPNGPKTKTNDVVDCDTYIVAVETLPHCALTDYDDEKESWQYQSTFEWFGASLPPSP